ncbi:hypothetical protein CFC21_087886 [Triticum aestivum]|uniref:Uncharacterized protein n=2 Tax=Triticum aestivum TaxID=4565 RepID=A0A9R1IHL4_WHEAT|nr:hypothetical protein CFC21_087886 [Triticum aestivum]
MNPMLNHSDPANQLILQESNVGFSLLNASLVNMPVFNEKQWILIIANFRAKFFDIMNLYYSGDTFLPTISVIIYNFKVLFAATYGNSSSFNIGNFESRFVPAPKFNFSMTQEFSFFSMLASTKVSVWRVSLISTSKFPF